MVVQSPLGSEPAVPGSPQQAQENSADVEQELRQWCSTPTEDKTPSPLSLERDATPEPSEPGASPSDTSYTEAAFLDSDEDICPEPDLLDESYRPDNSFNSDDEPDSDTSIWSNDSVHSDGATDVEYVSTVIFQKPELHFMNRIKLGLPIWKTCNYLGLFFTCKS